MFDDMIDMDVVKLHRPAKTAVYSPGADDTLFLTLVYSAVVTECWDRGGMSLYVFLSRGAPTFIKIFWESIFFILVTLLVCIY